MALIGGLLGAFLLFAGVMAISTVPRDLARPGLTAEQHRQARAALDSQLETVVMPYSPTQAAASQSWTCLLTEQQIQAWLEDHLPTQPSFAVPGALSQPQVSFRETDATFACTFQSSTLHSVVSIDLEPFVVSEPNRLGIRVQRARAGWLPVPLSKVIWRISCVARDAGLQLQCHDEGGHASGVLTLPTVEAGQSFHIQECTITPQGLALKGTTESATRTE